MNTIDSPLADEDAEQIIDWLEDGTDVIHDKFCLELSCPDGWKVVIEPDGDVDDYGKMIDCSTALVYRHGVRFTDLNDWERDIYSAANSYTWLHRGPYG